MSTVQSISKATQSGKTGSSLHKTGSDKASPVKGISPTANTPLNAFYSAGPVFGLGLPVQTKLTIGAPGDKYEREADRVADQVMRMPETSTCPECPEKEEIQTKPMTGRVMRKPETSTCPECPEKEGENRKHPPARNARKKKKFSGNTNPKKRRKPKKKKQHRGNPSSGRPWKKKTRKPSGQSPVPAGV
jgi:hypothetical protein